LSNGGPDKQKAVKAALLHPNGAKMSDRQLAEYLGVADVTVGRHRKEMESTATLLQSTERTGRDGRTIDTSNIGKRKQDELSPLEIGLHALKAVPPQQGKKGKGLSAYAEKIGKSQQYISQVRSAAEVVVALHKSTCEVGGLLDKAQHLCAIHKEKDRDLWPVGRKSKREVCALIRCSNRQRQIMPLFNPKPPKALRRFEGRKWRCQMAIGGLGLTLKTGAVGWFPA
jgi:hypothetical protein